MAAKSRRTTVEKFNCPPCGEVSKLFYEKPTVNRKKHARVPTRRRRCQLPVEVAQKTEIELLQTLASKTE